MAKKPEKSKPETREIAGAGASSADAYDFYTGELAQPTDPKLRSKGGDLAIYENIRRDEQVHTTFQQRRRAVTSRDWNVEPGGDAAIDQQAADDLKEQISNLSWDRITERMLWGLFYGYAVAECMWEIDASRVQLADVKVRNRKRFRFGRDGSLRLLTKDKPTGMIMPDRKFWTFTAGADNDDDVYGLGLAYWLYWPVFFKRNGIKSWAIVLEKFGQPTTIGHYDASATEEEKKKLLSAIRAVATDVGIIIPQGMEIEFMEATRRAGGDHEKFAQYMDLMIAKVILSQTMTTESGSSLSQAQVHMDVRNDVVESDADLVCESFNKGPVTWLTAWNFPNAATPRVWRVTDDPEDLNQLAERDERLFNIGYKPTAERIAETYGPGYEGVVATAMGQPTNKPLSFAEHIAKDAADDLTGQLDTVAAPAMDVMINQIRSLIDSADSLQDVADKLIELYPDIDDSSLADVMGQALSVAELTGQSEIIDG